MLNNTDENIAFFNRWSKWYGFGAISLWLRLVQRRVLNNIVFDTNSRILDIGCGPGYGLSFFKKHNIKNLAGIDISPKMIARAKKRFGNTAILKVASVERIPFPKGTFDVVTNTEAFHHFPNPQKSVLEMYRVLKPNGKLYLADINFFSEFIHRLFKKLEPGHVKIYSKEEFSRLLTNAGFKVIKQKRIAFFIILTVGEK